MKLSKSQQHIVDQMKKGDRLVGDTNGSVFIGRYRLLKDVSPSETVFTQSVEILKELQVVVDAGPFGGNGHARRYELAPGGS